MFNVPCVVVNLPLLIGEFVRAGSENFGDDEGSFLGRRELVADLVALREPQHQVADSKGLAFGLIERGSVGGPAGTWQNVEGLHPWPCPAGPTHLLGTSCSYFCCKIVPLETHTPSPWGGQPRTRRP